MEHETVKMMVRTQGRRETGTLGRAMKAALEKKERVHDRAVEDTGARERAKLQKVLRDHASVV